MLVDSLALSGGVEEDRDGENQQRNNCAIYLHILRVDWSSLRALIVNNHHMLKFLVA